MEDVINIPSCHRGHGLRDLLLTTALTAASLLALPAHALPTGGQVIAGQATVSTSGSLTTVTQATDRGVINWQSFDIAHGERVHFQQPTSSSVTLNRVTGGQGASQIMGQISATGTVMLVNPHGVVFGPTSQVNVGSLVATTADIANDRFMAGDYHFDRPGHSDAGVVNQGHITVSDAGLALFVAPNVVNDGIIEARLGKVQLASGDTFTLDLYGDGLVNLQASDALTSQLVSNGGIIAAEGGKVLLTAAAAGDVVNSLINMDGIVSATSIGEQNGEIVIFAEGANAIIGNDSTQKGQKQGSSNVVVSGTLDASGRGEGERGGKITVTGDNVALLSGTIIDASGHTGATGTTQGKAVSAHRDGSAGGDIRIGGDYLGSGETATAKNLRVEADVNILNDSLFTGDAGRTILWSDGSTEFYGNISARSFGGLALDTISWGADPTANSGNGGFVETSGKNTLVATGMVDASAHNGTRGTWLLDPNNITIINTANANITSSGTGPVTWSSTNDTSIVTVASLLASLNAGTDVVVQTTSSGANSQAGDITVASAINKTAGGDATLTLKADNSIIINSGANLTSTSNKLNIVLNADADASGAGAIAITSATLNSNGGNITLGGGANPLATAAIGTESNVHGVSLSNANLTAGSGSISIRGQGFSGTANSNYGVALGGGSVQTTSGNLTIVGNGGGTGTSTDNTGVRLSAATIRTTSGALSVSGAGGATGGGGVSLLYNSGGSSIESIGTGNVLVSGQAGGNGIGVSTNNSWIRSTAVGGGSVTVTGTGGTTGNGNTGVRVSGTVTFGIRSVDGAIAVTGQGGASTGDNNYGIETHVNGISGTGAANMLITGTGGGSGASTGNTGVRLSGRSTFSTTQGDMTLTGTGGATGGNGVEILYEAGRSVVRTAGAGSLSINGFGTGTGNGIVMNNSNVESTATGGGSITMTGVAGSAAASGLRGIVTSGSISSFITTVDGALTLNGTGGGGSGNNNHGLSLTQTTVRSTGAGAITLNGTGGSSTGSGHHGVSLGATVESTGTGSIAITGTGGSGANSHGLSLGGSITSAATDITMTSTAGNITSAGAGTIQAGGAGGILLTSANDINFTHDLDLNATGTGLVTLRANNSILYSGSGDITTQGGAITLNSDRDANQAGAISLGTGTVLTSNGGDITLGGGGTPAAGYAIGAATQAGVALTGVELSSGTGTITLRGQATDGVGINMAGGTMLNTTSGDMTLTGTSGTGAGNQIGTLLDNSSVTTQTGVISIIGQVAAGATGANDIGLKLVGSAVNSTGTGGSLSLHGNTLGVILGQAATAIGMLVDGSTITTNAANASLSSSIFTSSASGGHRKGIRFDNGSSVLSTGTGNISVKSWSPQASGTGYVTSTTFSNNGWFTLGGASAAGNITIDAGVFLTFEGGNNMTIQTTGNVQLFASGYMASIGVNGGSGSLNITSDILHSVSANTLIIGNLATNSPTIDFRGLDLSTTNYNLALNLGGGGNKKVLLRGDTTLAADRNFSVIGSLGHSSFESSGPGSINVSGTGSILFQSYRNPGYTAPKFLFAHDFDLITGGGSVMLEIGNRGGQIIYTGGGDITTNGGEILLNPLKSSAGEGTILLGSGTVLDSGGGNITLSGSTTPATGYAIGDPTYTSGVKLDGAQLLAGTNGNIVIRGRGHANGSNSYGVHLTNGAVLNTGGTGSISIAGIGGANAVGTGNNGIMIDGTGTTISSENGAITLTGTAGGGTVNYGINSGTSTTNITSAGGDIALNASGNATLGAVSSAAGTISAQATGAAANIDMMGNISVGAGKNLTLTAGNTITSSASHTITTSQIAGAGGDVTMTATSGGIDLTNTVINASGDVDLLANGDITLGGGATALAVDRNFTAASTTGGITTSAAGGIDVSGTGTISLTSGDDSDIHIAHDFDLTTGGTSLTLSSERSILYTGGGDITTNGGAITLNADRDANQAGAISLGTGTVLTSNGGDITLGGGSDPTTGHAFGTSTHGVGVSLTGASLNAGGGSITVNGRAGLNGSYSVDVSNTSISTSGTGSISMTGDSLVSGRGGLRLVSSSLSVADGDLSVIGRSITYPGGGSALAVTNSTLASSGLGRVTLLGQIVNYVNNYYSGMTINGTSSVTSAYGDISITGLAGSAQGFNSGLILSGSGGIHSTGTGPGAAKIILTGTGRPGYSGVDVESAISTIDGDIILNGNANGGLADIAFRNSGAINVAGAASITFNGKVSLQKNMSFATNQGDIHFNNVINSGGAARNLTLNASQGAVHLGGSIGSTNALAAVSITSANDLVLPSITASSLVARTTGANADLTLGGNITSSATSGNAVVLVAGRHFQNAGDYSIGTTGTGRWLVYSTNPSDDTVGSLASDFRRFSCEYGGSCPSFPASGNGFLYSYTPMLTVAPTGGYVLDRGDAAPNLTGYGYNLSGYLSGDALLDSVTGSLNGSTPYTPSSNAGTYGIHHASGALTSALGYGFIYASSPSAIKVRAPQPVPGVDLAASMSQLMYSANNVIGRKRVAVSRAFEDVSLTETRDGRDSVRPPKRFYNILESYAMIVADPSLMFLVNIPKGR